MPKSIIQGKVADRSVVGRMERNGLCSRNRPRLRPVLQQEPWGALEIPRFLFFNGTWYEEGGENKDFKFECFFFKQMWYFIFYFLGLLLKFYLIHNFELVSNIKQCDSVIYIYIIIFFFQILFYYGLLQDTESDS